MIVTLRCAFGGKSVPGCLVARSFVVEPEAETEAPGWTRDADRRVICPHCAERLYDQISIDRRMGTLDHELGVTDR